MAESKRRPPTPRVIAAMWVLQQLRTHGSQSLSPQELSSLTESKVNAVKVLKVLGHAGKLTGKFIERMRNIVDKYENPPPRDPDKKIGFARQGD